MQKLKTDLQVKIMPGNKYESLIKAVETEKDRLARADLRGAYLEGAVLAGVHL